MHFLHAKHYHMPGGIYCPFFCEGGEGGIRQPPETYPPTLTSSTRWAPRNLPWILILDPVRVAERTARHGKVHRSLRMQSFDVGETPALVEEGREATMRARARAQ